MEIKKFFKIDDLRNKSAEYYANFMAFGAIKISIYIKACIRSPESRLGEILFVQNYFRIIFR